MKNAIAFSVGALLLVFGTVTKAQEATLMQIGDFVGDVAPNLIGGVEDYVVDCDEKAMSCEDNLENTWTFGEPFLDAMIFQCDENRDVLAEPCVRTIQVNLRANKVYRDAYIEFQRYKCGVQDVYFDGKYLGQVRGDEAGNGIRIRVKLPLGMIKKKKNHVLLVTAPVNDFAYCGLPGYQIVMDGFAIKGSP